MRPNRTGPHRFIVTSHGELMGDDAKLGHGFGFAHPRTNGAAGSFADVCHSCAVSCSTEPPRRCSARVFRSFSFAGCSRSSQLVLAKRSKQAAVLRSENFRDFMPAFLACSA